MAYLRDLYVYDEWTRRFTELVDKNVNFADADEILYLHAGTGGHPLMLEEYVGPEVEILATCDDEFELSIASEKALAVGSKVEFSDRAFGDDSFSCVIADLSLKPAKDYAENIETAIRKARPSGDVAIFLTTAGSFGELFSVLWEAIAASDEPLPIDVEKLIADLPTAARAEEAAAKAGLVNIKTRTSTEVFDFETGEELLNSVLVGDLFFPMWTERLDEEQRKGLKEKTAGLIKAELGDLSFQFAVKATLITGKRA